MRTTTKQQPENIGLIKPITRHMTHEFTKDDVNMLKQHATANMFMNVYEHDEKGTKVTYFVVIPWDAKGDDVVFTVSMIIDPWVKAGTFKEAIVRKALATIEKYFVKQLESLYNEHGKHS